MDSEKYTGKTLLLIDSHALIYRAYFAYPPTLTAAGEPINAVFGFASLLLDVLLKFKPSNVIAVMDSEDPTIRSSNYTQYKANRKAADPELIQQFPKVAELIKTFQIPLLKLSGYEADDIIGTIDQNHSGSWARTIIVTGDRDLFQLVDKDTFVYLAGSSFFQSKLYNEQMVIEKMGVAPKFIPDYKGISGDPSDNIPGVKGIGPKGASDLINNFGTLEEIYNNIEKVDKRYASKLAASHEIALLSKNLATIDRNVPLSFDFKECEFEEISIQPIQDIFNELQFRSLQPKLDKLSERFAKKSSYTLFDDESPNVKQNITEWSGEVFDNQERIFIFFDIEPAINPLQQILKKGYFGFEDNDTVYAFDSGNIQKFFDLIKAKEVLTFDWKNILHIFRNNDLAVSDDQKVRDLGIESVIVSCGKCAYTFKSLVEYFQQPWSSEVSNSIKHLKIICAELDKQLANLANFSNLIFIELRILRVVLEMERKGIRFDIEAMKAFEQKLEEELKKLKKDIFVSIGHEFNLNSPKQLGDILFKEKSLPVNKKTKSGSFATDEATLRKLVEIDPVIEMILKYRELDKLMSTYVKTLPSYVDSYTRRIHASFDSLGAVSGRFSSKNPNMQNIPKEDSFGVSVRNTFIASEDSVFLTFDYSQQELRILAALSGEVDMIESFNTGKDIHRLTAADIFNVDIDDVDAKQRGIGKTINFSVIYGISPFALSDRLKIPRAEAALFIEKYFNRYPKVKSFLAEILEKARQNKYSESILGRRRINEMIVSPNKNLRSAAERELFNFVIQGSAADVMKISMNKIHEVIKSYEANLLLQIHDEFLFEFKTSHRNNPSEDKKLQTFVKEICDTMVDAYDIGVKYSVEASAGLSWGEMNSLV